jgi:hypothetical protein
MADPEVPSDRGDTPGYSNAIVLVGLDKLVIMLGRSRLTSEIQSRTNMCVVGSLSQVNPSFEL